MDSPRSDNLYRRCNYSLFPLIGSYQPWTDAEFESVIARIESLPEPDSPRLIEDLKASRLGETLPNLAREIERSALFPESDGSLDLSGLSKRIERLWNACKPLVTCFEVRGYAAFANCAIKKQASPSLLLNIFAASEAHGAEMSRLGFERALATDVREAIKEREIKRLERAFDRAEACGVQFQNFNWGAFARDSRKVEDEFVFAVVWSRSKANRIEFNLQTWVSTSDAAGQVQRSDLIEEALNEWLTHGDPSDAAVWGSFANAIAKVHSKSLLEKLRESARANIEHFSAETWGAFAKAAGRTRDGDLLAQFWRELSESGSTLTSATLGSFSLGAGETRQGDLLEQIWKAWQESGTVLDGAGWGSFAYGAGNTNRPDLLREMFRSWRPKPNTLLEAEHGIWGSFLWMAFRLHDEDLFIEMFRRLSSMIDPIRLHNWGTLSPLLWKLVPQLKSKEIAAYVVETLSGLRLDTDRCFELLSTNEPSQGERGYKPFEGAARCLMRWLINSYFFCTPEVYTERLSYVVDGFLALKQNRPQAWLAFLGRSQGVYFGCLRGLYGLSYRQYFSFVEPLSDAELLEEIKAGNITKKLIEFENSALHQITVPAVSLDLPGESGANRLTPVLDYLWANQRQLLTAQERGNPATFFSEIARLLDEADTETLTREDWIDFLNLLLSTMSRRVWETLLSLAPDNIHDLKNSFYRIFQRRLTDGEVLEDQRQQFAETARQFLGDLGNILGSYRFGEVRPISIASLVKSKLLAGRRTGVVVADIATPFHILVFEGARNEILIPMLREIRFNAERALTSLLEEEQFYRVSLNKGAGEDADFGILEVANAYGTDTTDDISTGFGRKIVQSLAASIGGGAVPTKYESDGRRIFAWKIYLPLSKGYEGAGKVNE